MAAHSSVLAWRIHGQRSLVGYSPWGRKESDTLNRLSTHAPNDKMGPPDQTVPEARTSPGLFSLVS